MDKQKQMIEEMVNLDIEQSVSGYSAFINDMRISKAKPLSVSKTIISLDCPKKYIYEAIGIPENAVVLTKEEYEKLKSLSTIEEITLGAVYDNTRKETAEKFAERVKEETDHGISALYDSKVDEICKEITEGKNDGI